MYYNFQTHLNATSTRHDWQSVYYSTHYNIQLNIQQNHCHYTLLRFSENSGLTVHTDLGKFAPELHGCKHKMECHRVKYSTHTMYMQKGTITMAATAVFICTVLINKPEWVCGGCVKQTAVPAGSGVQVVFLGLYLEVQKTLQPVMSAMEFIYMLSPVWYSFKLQFYKTAKRVCILNIQVRVKKWKKTVKKRDQHFRNQKFLSAGNV